MVDPIVVALPIASVVTVVGSLVTAPARAADAAVAPTDEELDAAGRGGFTAARARSRGSPSRLRSPSAPL
jgi:hypothetical protein